MPVRGEGSYEELPARRKAEAFTVSFGGGGGGGAAPTERKRTGSRPATPRQFLKKGEGVGALGTSGGGGSPTGGGSPVAGKNRADLRNAIQSFKKQSRMDKFSDAMVVVPTKPPPPEGNSNNNNRRTSSPSFRREDSEEYEYLDDRPPQTTTRFEDRRERDRDPPRQRQSYDEDNDDDDDDDALLFGHRRAQRGNQRGNGGGGGGGGGGGNTRLQQTLPQHRPREDDDFSDSELYEERRDDEVWNGTPTKRRGSRRQPRDHPGRDPANPRDEEYGRMWEEKLKELDNVVNMYSRQADSLRKKEEHFERSRQLSNQQAQTELEERASADIKKLRRERQVLQERCRSLSAAQPQARKDREELEQLQDELALLKEEWKQKEYRYKSQVDRLQKQVKELQAKSGQLSSTLKQSQMAKLEAQQV